MRICVKFVIPEPGGSRRTFTLHTDRPYPSVPRQGDAITPDDGGQLAPRQIMQVVFEPDGTTTLVLDPALPTDDPEAFIMVLKTVGFEEIDPVHLP